MTPSFKFEEVLKTLGLSRTQFAAKAGLRPEQLSRFFPCRETSPARSPQLATALRIIGAAEGLLTLNDFHGIPRRRMVPVGHMCPLCGRSELRNHQRPKQRRGNSAAAFQAQA
jgi:hypothetical protein